MENQEQKPTTQEQPVPPVTQETPNTASQPVVPKKMSFWQKLRFNLRGGKYRNRYNEDVNKVKATRAAEQEAHKARPQKQTYQVNAPQATATGVESPPVPQTAPVSPASAAPTAPPVNVAGPEGQDPKTATGPEILRQAPSSSEGEQDKTAQGDKTQT